MRRTLALVALTAVALGSTPASLMARQATEDPVRRGMALLEDNRIEEAVRTLGAAVRADPDDAVARYQFGRALFAAGRPGDAVEHLEAAREKVEEPGPVEFLLGQVYIELGRLADARESLELARRSRPDYPPVRLYLAEVCYRAGRPAAARERMATLAAGYPGWSTPVVRLGALALEAGDPEAAEEHFLEALERETGRPAPIWTRIAGARAAAGDTEGALEAYRRAVAADPSFIPARSSLARYLQNERRLDAALDEYDAVLERAPGYGPARLGRAEILALKGEGERALEEVEIALLDLRSEVGGAAVGETGPVSQQGRELRAELLMKEGRYRAAIRESRRILESDPRSLKARFVLGTALMRSGDPAGREQLETYKRLNDAAEQRELGDYHRTRVDEPESSREAYRAALEADPTDPAALLGLAVLDRRAGRAEPALEALEAARAAGAAGIEWYEERILALLAAERRETAWEVWWEAHEEELRPGGEAAATLWADEEVCPR